MSPPPRTRASGNSTLSFSSACRLCSARSMYSIVNSFSHRLGMAPCVTHARPAWGTASTM